MTDQDRERIPDDLKPVADRLRAERQDVTAHDLDRLKLRVMARAKPARSAPRPLGRRSALSSAFIVLALGASLGGGLALAGKAPPSSPPASGASSGSAANNQYRPGLGCGDRNHIHQRNNECQRVNGLSGGGSANLATTAFGGGHNGTGQIEHGELPLTGSDASALALLGMLTLLLGASLRQIVRRRHS